MYSVRDYTVVKHVMASLPNCRPAPPSLLGLGAAALVIQTTTRAARRRLGLGPRARHVQGVSQPLGQALQGEIAVARLRARVLRDGGHARPQFGAYPRFLCLG